MSARRDEARDARALRTMLGRDQTVYTLAPCVVIDAGIRFDHRLAPGRVWYKYAASGLADPRMLKLLRTPDELDRLFRAGIPDAALVAGEDPSFQAIVERYCEPAKKLSNGALYVSPSPESAAP